MRITPVRLAVAYVAVATAWILASDAVLVSLGLPEDLETWANVAKGWGFVLLTGAGLLVLSRALVARAEAERSAAEAALERERQARRDLGVLTRRYEQMVREAPIAISVVDEEARIVEWNPASERLWGWSADEVVGRRVPWPPLDADGPDGRELARRVLASEQPGPIRVRRRRRDGAVVYAETVAVPLEPGDGRRLILGMTRDVTAEAEARRRVDRSMALLATLQAVAAGILDGESLEVVGGRAVRDLRALLAVDRVGLFTYDVAAGTATVLAVDEDAPTPDAGAGQVLPIDAAQPPAIRHATAPVLVADLAAELGHVPFVGRVAAGGFRAAAMVPLRVRDETVGMIALATRSGRLPDADDLDAATQVATRLALGMVWSRARRALEDTTERLRTILEGSPNPILVVSPDGRVEYANPASDRTFGREVTGVQVDELVDEPVRHRHALAVRAWFEPAEGRPPHPVRADARHADGTTFPVEVLLALVDAPEGPRAIATIVDLSDREALEARLRQGARLETLGEFAGILAHDVRNYLTAVSWSAELLAHDLSEDDPRAHDVDLIRRATAAGIDMTRSVLEFARPTTEIAGRTDLAEHLGQTLALVRRIVGSEVHVALDVPADLPPVAVAGPALTQVVVNLAANARDAMPGGGTLRLAAHAINGRPPGAGHLPPGRYVRLTVADTGSGMDEATRARAFDAFFTTKTGTDAAPGTGLGLSSAFLIVNRARGAIEVASAPGQGTVFTIDLPATA